MFEFEWRETLKLSRSLNVNVLFLFQELKK